MIEEIQRWFKQMSLLIHPDKWGQTELLQLLNHIRCVLMDDGAPNIYETHEWKFMSIF